jgi:hypothetical protein
MGSTALRCPKKLGEPNRMVVSGSRIGTLNIFCNWLVSELPFWWSREKETDLCSFVPGLYLYCDSIIMGLHERE